MLFSNLVHYLTDKVHLMDGEYPWVWELLMLICGILYAVTVTPNITLRNKKNYKMQEG